MGQDLVLGMGPQGLVSAVALWYWSEGDTESPDVAGGSRLGMVAH